MRAIIEFENIISRINDRFMRIMHDIFHTMSKGNTFRFYWSIHIAT